MSLILFFGFTAFIIVVGTIFSGLVIRHHWRKSREINKKTSSDTIAPSAT